MSGYAVLGDWGTSRLRLYRIGGGAITGRLTGPGIAALDGPAERTIAAALAPWTADAPADRIVLGGMVGSRNGWRETPYAACPCAAGDWRMAAVRLALDGIPVTIAGGLACVDTDGRPDVMRGEEMQIFGALALDPALRRGRRLLALPGTHGKWATVEDGTVTGFRTFLTGELFAVLRDHSMLLRAAGDAVPIPDDEGFAAGVDRIVGGAPLLGALFETRSAQLRAGRSPGWAAGFLSGLLIGSEVVETAALDPQAEIVLIGDPTLLDRYVRALERVGRRVRLFDGEDCAVAGLGLLEE